MADRKPPVNSIPVIFVSGSHYEASRLTGKTFATNIKTHCENQAEFFDKAIAYCNTKVGKEYYDGFYEVGQRRCPQYMDEIRGLADGSGVSFQKIFLLNHFREFGDLLHDNEDSKDKAEGPVGCTDILVSSGKNVLLGHTEDIELASKDTDYVVVANIVESTNEDGQVYEAEKFVAYCIAGDIPGWCMGFNHHGMAYVRNILFPTMLPCKNKLGKALHQRYLLNAKNVEDVLKIAEDKDNGSNSAFCLNFGFQGNSTLYSVEICPMPQDVPENVIHVREIPNDENGSNTGHYVHTNHCREMKIPENMGFIENSAYRLKTAGSAKPLKTMGDICEMLGLVNQENVPEIPGLPVTTLCAGIMDLVNGELHMYRNRPAPSERPLLRIPFSILK